ncbi:unnamed protein product [Soboliphyme baturini]|uniref:Innexin n=1 Tax=Soboliphyme baturini TaxID=241478 RepID=A0A183J107_9BILA|nr:unnamed protein product [Soboliphyme baturini]
MNFLSSCFNSLKPRNDDDAIDRLNYYYTCLIILFLSITITAKQYVGQPIQCWVPPQFTSSWEQYAENYCFVQNTFWIPMKEPIPSDRQRVSVSHVGYYQWVPFILAVEASLFYVPSLIWKFFNRRSGNKCKLTKISFGSLILR